MAQNYRKLVTDSLFQVVDKSFSISRQSFRVSKTSHRPELHVQVQPALESSSIPGISAALESDNRVQKAYISNDKRGSSFVLQLCPDRFVRNILVSNPPSKRKPAKPVKTLIEFSSPNIAKPFHAGHLRSTIIGNFLGNLYDHLGHEVIRVNYLGDWGTQFGYLKLGVDLKGLSKEDIRRNPIQTLYEAYVYAYGEAANSEHLQGQARRIFSELENGTFRDLAEWSEFRSYTVDELKQLYHRLGVTFDCYHWESQYGFKQISDVISLLREHNLLVTQDDGRQVAKVRDRNIPLVKSDGTTLYLTRDIAALIDRHEHFQFDRAIYVVDNAQTDHFSALIAIAQRMQLPYASNITHTKFGRVLGMSTRKGTVVFLKDILDEAESLMKKKQLEARTTKIDVDSNPEVAAILGATAVVVNDLKQRRMRDYDFAWDRALQSDGDSGIKLQYTHCRLWNLQENAAAAQHASSCATITFEPCLLAEPAALHLVCEIARYEEVLAEAAEKHEACIVVNYLFGLCNSTSRALQSLNVINEPSIEKSTQRAHLFASARRVLHHGMEILGLKPLQKM